MGRVPKTSRVHKAASGHHRKVVSRRTSIASARNSNEAMLTGILSIAEDAVILVNTSQNITFFNRGAEKIFGFTAREVTGKPLDILISPRFAEEHRKRIAQFRKSPTSATVMSERGPITGRRRDGTEFFAEASISKWGTSKNMAFAVFLRDISERIKMQRDIEYGRSVLATSQETSPDAILLVDQNAEIVSYNKRFMQMWGIPEKLVEARTDEPVLQTVIAQVENPDAFLARVRYLYEHPEEESQEEIRTKDGRIIERHSAPVVGPSKEYFGRIWHFRDITERKRAEASLTRSNRALRVLSATNHVLIHSEWERTLLDQVCKIIVEHGGYRLAWIGFVEHDAAKTIRPVAQTGYEVGYLENAAITWADTERGRGPTGTAVRTGIVQISQYIASDPKMAPWRSNAIKLGYASSMAIPLRSNSETIGVLSIYSSEPDAFDEGETVLLRELADDLAFGIVTHRSQVARREAEAKAEQLANFDALTGLPNRLYLFRHLQQTLKNEHNDESRFAVMTISVDRFDEVQDAVGIEGADSLLEKIGERLKNVADHDTFLARVARDSFAILPRRCDAEGAGRIAERIRIAINNPFEHAGIPVDLPMTIGVALFPDHSDDADSLLVRSAIAVRQARAGGTDFAMYAGKIDSESPQRLTLLAELRRAIRKDELVLHYHPKIDVSTGRISGVEALVRWQHPDRGMVPPNQFIPLAEHTGLIKPLTYWVLEAALRQIVEWRERRVEVSIAVNVSPNNLRDPEFIDRITGLQAKTGASSDLMTFEITETALMEDPARAQEMLVHMKDLGIRVHLDDFGTGYSSLSYIATLPIQALKIDRSFVLKMMEEKQHRAVVRAAISLAHSLGLKVVGEGIESVDQAKALVQEGCDEIQGYLFSRPLPAEEFVGWYASFNWEKLGLGISNSQQS